MKKGVWSEVKGILRHTLSVLAGYVMMGGFSMALLGFLLHFYGEPLSMSATAFGIGVGMILVGTLSRRALLSERSQENDRKLNRPTDRSP